MATFVENCTGPDYRIQFSLNQNQWTVELHSGKWKDSKFARVIIDPWDHEMTMHRTPAGTERRPNQSWTNIVSVQGRTNPEPILNQFWTNRMAWSVRPPFSYGSHTYVRIRSHFGSAEPILNQKCLQGRHWRHWYFRPIPPLVSWTLSYTWL